MKLEAELVAILSRSPLGDSREVRARELLQCGLDWTAVFAWAKAFEVEPVCHRNLIQLGAGIAPENVIADSVVLEQAARAEAIAACLRVVDVSSRLEEGGVRAIVLKGPAAGLFAYGDPALRTFGDTDVLVRREMISNTRDILIAAGFVRNYAADEEPRIIGGGHALEFSRESSYVEVHGELLERHLSFDIGSDSLWEEAERITVPGGDIWSLDPARLFLFMCAHGTKHAWSRFRWICDIAQFAERLPTASATKVIDLARTYHGERVLGVALSLLDKVYGTRPTVFANYMVDSRANELTRACLASLGLEPAGQDRGWQRSLDDDSRALLFWVRSRERKRDTLKTLAHVAFVPTANDWPGGPLSWVTRPIRLSGRMASRVIRGSWAR